MSVIYINSYQFSAAAYDTDALNYISRVETAESQTLETAVKDAINAFFVGCKSDGNFNALKDAHLLSGVFTFAGMQQPLISTGNTPSFVNFLAADYDRKTGLKADGVSKYINSNRSANADPQNSKHVAVYTTQASTSTACLIGHRPNTSTDVTQIIEVPGSFTRTKVNGSVFAEITASPVAGFFGGNRSSSTQITARANGTTVTASATSLTPSSDTIIVCARRTGATIEVYSDARFSFYSIGESLNLALLDARVTTLMSALAAAIP